MSGVKGFCALCCSPCIACCCPPDDPTKDKYPYIKYSSPTEAKSALQDAQEYKVPLDKMSFEFAQPPAEFPIHPQMTNSSDTDSTDIIADQPRLLRPLAFDQSGTSRESAPADLEVPSSFPTIQYALYYDIQRNVLSVHLQQIYNLPTRQKDKNVDSLVCLYLTPHKEEEFESKVVQKSLNPVFGQEFEFKAQPGMELARKQVLIFKIFEHSRHGAGELLGVVPIKLEEADLFGETTRTRIQESMDVTKMESMGDILLSLTYQPQADSLHGILLKAANLKQQDITGTADPYVKVCLFHRGKNIHKWKSSTKKNTLTPVFNESFQFNIYNMDTNEMHLDIVMMEYDRFSRDDVVGVVQIGADISYDKGQTHWEEVMNESNEPISRWHQILPVSSDREHAHTL